MTSPAKSTNDLNKAEDWTLLAFREDDEKQLEVIPVAMNTQQMVNRQIPTDASSRQTLQLFYKTVEKVEDLSKKVEENNRTITSLVLQNCNFDARLKLQKEVEKENIQNLKTNSKRREQLILLTALFGATLVIGPGVACFAGGAAISFAIDDGIAAFRKEEEEWPTKKEILNCLEKNKTFGEAAAIAHLWSKKLALTDLDNEYKNFVPTPEMIAAYQKKLPQTSPADIVRKLFSMHESHYVNPVVENERQYSKEHQDLDEENTIYQAFKKHAAISGFIPRPIAKRKIEEYIQNNQGKTNNNPELVGSSYYHTLQRDATRKDAIRDCLILSFVDSQNEIRIRQSEEFQTLLDGSDGRGSSATDFEASAPSNSSGGLDLSDVGGYGYG